MTNEKKLKEGMTLSEENVELFISDAIKSYHDKNMLIDGMFWGQAIGTLCRKYGILEAFKNEEKAVMEEIKENEKLAWIVSVYRIGTEKGLSGCELDVFANFFLERFPEDRDRYYCAEWAQRFKNEKALAYADGKSKEIIFAVMNAGARLTITKDTGAKP